MTVLPEPRSYPRGQSGEVVVESGGAVGVQALVPGDGGPIWWYGANMTPTQESTGRGRSRAARNAPGTGVVVPVADNRDRAA